MTANDDPFDHDALAADAREIVEFVESVHPEPYIGYDGRVDLHATLERTVRDLPKSATREEFYRQAAPLVAGLDDAHSLLRNPNEDEDERELPLSFRVVGDDLYVDAVHDDRLTVLLGGKLLAVEGESIDALAGQVGRFRGTENDYYARDEVASFVGEYRSLGRLFDRTTPPEDVTLRIAAGENVRTETLEPREIEGSDDDSEPVAALDSSFPHPAGSGPRYRLYEDGDAAVFVPGDLSGYRESHELAVALGAGRAEELAPDAYERHVGGNPPEDLAELVAELPSMTEALTGLVEAMEAADTETLVVDVRDNPGGDSSFLLHLAYVLRGQEGLDALSGGTRVIKRRTAAHRERYGSHDNPPANPAGYDFEGYVEGEGKSPAEQLEMLGQAGTFGEIVDTSEHEGRYDPERIVVVTTAGTMSSGFAVAAQLTTLGAEVVGVPSGQAPISFGEAVEREVSNTGLTARVACSMYHWVPDPDGRVLEPDAELTPERFEGYDRAADAGLRLAFDHAGHTDGEPPEPADD